MTIISKLETVNINDLTVRDGNPNRMTPEQLESLDYSIDRFGVIQYIIVDQNNVIVNGAQRYNVLKDKGFTEIDVVRVDLKDENELKMLSQVCNKLHGDHETKPDITELEVLMGFNPIELKSLLGFDEAGLDLMRQKAAEEEQQISNMNMTQPVEKKDVEFKANLKHQCPSCGYIFK
jgi:ParB-like chromosome segregation protein Spo0J